MLTDLILGGGGFIGRHVGLALARQGRRVRLAGRRTNHAIRDHLNELLSYEIVDIRTANWPQVLDGVDVVHHYAWSTVPQIADADPVEDLDSNVRSTVALLQAMRKRDGTRLIFASSGGTVYGRVGTVPIPESHELEPVSLYGAAKVAAEQYISVYRRAYNLDCRIARLSNPFGIGQRFDHNQGAASIFTHKAMLREPIRIFGDGSIMRDYIHISDAVSGLVALATLQFKPEMPFVFNLGSGIGTDLNTIVDILSTYLNREISVQYLPGRPYDVPVNILDISRALCHLEWQPRLDLPAGVALAITDYLNGARYFSSLPPNLKSAECATSV